MTHFSLLILKRYPGHLNAGRCILESKTLKRFEPLKPVTFRYMELLHPGDGGSVVLGLFTYTGDFLMYMYLLLQV